jgi:hypothetical protein
VLKKEKLAVEITDVQIIEYKIEQEALAVSKLEVAKAFRDTILKEAPFVIKQQCANKDGTSSAGGGGKKGGEKGGSAVDDGGPQQLFGVVKIKGTHRLLGFFLKSSSSCLSNEGMDGCSSSSASCFYQNVHQQEREFESALSFVKPLHSSIQLSKANTQTDCEKNLLPFSVCLFFVCLFPSPFLHFFASFFVSLLSHRFTC